MGQMGGMGMGMGMPGMGMGMPGMSGMGMPVSCIPSSLPMIRI